jgi:hypothetical protein
VYSQCATSLNEVFVNEIYFGTDDNAFIELGVNGSGNNASTVNLEGYIIDDNNNFSSSCSTRGHIKLGSFFQNIRSGSIIVIYDDSAEVISGRSNEIRVVDNKNIRRYLVPFSNDYIIKNSICPSVDSRSYRCSANRIEEASWNQYISLNSSSDALIVKDPSELTISSLSWGSCTYNDDVNPSYINLSGSSIDFNSIENKSVVFAKGINWLSSVNYTMSVNPSLGLTNGNLNQNIFYAIQQNAAALNGFDLACTVIQNATNGSGGIIEVAVTEEALFPLSISINGLSQTYYTSPVTFSDLSPGDYTIRVVDGVGCSGKCQTSISNSIIETVTICPYTEFTFFPLQEDDCESWGPSDLFPDGAADPNTPILITENTTIITTISDDQGNIIEQITTQYIVEDDGTCDTDDDGILDSVDNCPNSYNPDQLNDSDHDGVCDHLDNCPNNANSDQADTDGDGIGDICDDGDADDDGLPDEYDDCPHSANNVDSDADGICDSVDNCPYVVNPNQDDADGDGIGDVCDDPDGDTDDDGIPDDVDPCPTAHIDFDLDGDCIPDNLDNCYDQANPEQADVDGDGIGDICDPFNNMEDLDGDGIPDCKENDEDDDGDGIPNNEDGDNDDPCNANPIVFLPSAPVLCGAQMVLQVEGEYASYLWDTGQTGESITVQSVGNYKVTVTEENGCTYESSVEVKPYNPESIEEILLENGYLAIPGTLSELPEIKENEEEDDTKLISLGVTVDNTDGGLFSYKGGESYTILDLVETSSDLMSDEVVAVNFITHQVCGESGLSIEEFLNYSNSGSNISVFALDKEEENVDDILYVKVRSNNENYGINIAEIKRVSEIYNDLGDPEITFENLANCFKNFVDQYLPGVGGQWKSIVFSGVVISKMDYIIQKLGIDEVVAFDDLKTMITLMEDKFEDLQVDLTKGIIPKSAWENSQNILIPFGSGLIDGAWEELYGLLLLEDIGYSLFTPWGYCDHHNFIFFRDVEKCEQYGNMRKQIVATVHLIAKYVLEDLVSDITTGIASWNEYFSNTEWNEISMLLLDPDAPFDTIVRNKLRCIFWPNNNITNYPGFVPEIFGPPVPLTYQECLYDKGKIVFFIAQFFIPSNKIKTGTKTGKAADVNEGLLVTKNTISNIFNNQKDKLNALEPDPDKLVKLRRDFDIDFAADNQDILKKFDSEEISVNVWKVLDDVPGANTAFRSKINNLEAIDGFFAKYPSRIDEFKSVLNDVDLHPSLLDKEAFLTSIKIFDDIPSITNTSQLIDVLTNVRSVHRVSDLEAKGLNKFFRGTNVDANGVPYPGNPNTIANGTSTSSDPIVATIFGIEARTEFGGSGKLLLYQPANLGSTKLKPPNYRVELEREIIMDVTPTNIYGMKDFEIDVDDARSIIQQITWHNLDSSIPSSFSTQALQDAPRMTPAQVDQFYQMASEL